MADTADDWVAPPPAAPAIADDWVSPQQAQPYHTTAGSAAKNVVSGLTQGVEGMLPLAAQVVQQMPGADIATSISKAFGLPTMADSASSAVHATNELLGKFGLNPESVKPQTTAERIAQGAGFGASAAVMPEAGAETLAAKGLGALKNAGLGTLAGVGGTGASEFAPDALKPEASIAGSAITALLPSGAKAAAEKLFSPANEDPAGKYVAALMQNAGKSTSDLRDAVTQAFGKPIIGAEAIGRPGMTALTALGRREGRTPEALEGMLSERAAGRTGRILGDFAEASGIDPNAAQGDIDTMVANGRQNAKPLFDYALSGIDPVWNDDLARLAKRPAIAKAMASAATDLRNADIDPYIMGLHFDEAGNMTAQSMPTAKAWDLVKKNLNDAVQRDPFGKMIPDTQSRGNFNLNAANRDLTGALRDAIPMYGEALDQSGEYLSLNRAFQNGQKTIFNAAMPAKAFGDQFSKLSQPEQEAFKGGIANAMFNQAQNGRVPPGFFNRPVLQEKLSTALGEDNAAEFLQKMKVESDMSRWGARMAPGTNSVTSDVLNATNEQDKSGAAMHAIQAAVHGIKGNVVAMGMSLARSLQSLKAAGMPVSVRDDAGRLLMMHPEDLANRLTSMDPKDPNTMPHLLRTLSSLKTVTPQISSVVAPPQNGTTQ